MTTNALDIAAMAQAACRLRDETYGCCKWDATGTYTVFKEVLLNWNLSEAWHRVIGHATDPEAETPGAIKRPFVPGPPVATSRNLTPAESCAGCGRERHRPDDVCIGRPNPATDVSAKVLDLRRNVVPLRPAKTRPEGA